MKIYPHKFTPMGEIVYTGQTSCEFCYRFHKGKFPNEDMNREYDGYDGYCDDYYGSCLVIKDGHYYPIDGYCPFQE